MILEGVKLMVIGMSTVFLFLLVQITLITLIAKLTRASAVKELEALEAEKLARSKKNNKSQGGSSIVAAISVAVAQYEADK